MSNLYILLFHFCCRGACYCVSVRDRDRLLVAGRHLCRCKAPLTAEQLEAGDGAKKDRTLIVW